MNLISALRREGYPTASRDLVTALTWTLGIVLAIGLRLSFFPFKSPDFENSLSPWYDYIVSHHGFPAMSDSFSDYAPSYLYLLCFMTYLPLPKLYAIKLLSMVFDFALAGVMASIVRTQKRRPIDVAMAFFLPLFCPSFLLNSAIWGQCDCIYSTFVLLAVRSFLGERYPRGSVYAGVALSFKLQTVFVLPALALILFKRKGPLLSLALIPATVLVSLVPAWLLGRPAWDLLTIYSRQSGEYKLLTLGATNIYQWVPHAPFGMFKMAGIWATAGALFFLLLMCAHSRQDLRRRGVLALVLASALACPFFLPLMHERYFYLADVLSILYAFHAPRRAWVALVIVSCSAMTCLPFLVDSIPVERPLLAIAMAVAGMVVLRDLYRELFAEPQARADVEDPHEPLSPSM